MSESNDRSVAARVFARLMRDAAFRDRLQSNHAVMCLESDTLRSMLGMLTRHYPEGSRVAVYYPSEHCFRFMSWSTSEPPAGADAVKAHSATTMGMAVAASSAENNDWASLITGAFSTREIEKQLA